jgi:GT2 family glycosyltransferase
MEVSIIIVSYNTKKLLRDCILSVRKFTKKLDYEVIVVDNNSTDGSIEYIKDIKDLKIIQNKRNLGFGQANNQGMKISRGRYILLLNSDTLFIEDSLSKMVFWMDRHPQVGIASCQLLNPDRTTQPTGGYFPNLLRLFFWANFLDDIPFFGNLIGSYHPRENFYKTYRILDWVTGAFVFMRREIYEQIGGFDKDFFMYVEDVDYCWRAKKIGWQIGFVPETSIIHFGGASSTGDTVQFHNTYGKEASIVGEFKGLVTFYKKHYPAWQLFLLSLILKQAALLRFLVFGIFKNQPVARRIYAKAFYSV